MALLKFLILGVLLISFAQGRTLLGTDDKPETPPYDVKNSTKALEVREYPEATWVVAFGRSRWAIDFAVKAAGLELGRYFKGGNVDHATISPTKPVIVTVLGRPPHPPHPPHPKNGSWPDPPHHKNGSRPKPPHHHDKPPPGPPAVAMSAYLPEKYQGKAPIPESRRVKVLQTNVTDLYVHKFGGWAFSWVVKYEMHHLALALKDIGICPRKGKFLVAIYDGPWKIFGRHNEVMWVKLPKRGHHNETVADVSQPQGWEAFDVQALFPDEFSNEGEGKFTEELESVEGLPTELTLDNAEDNPEQTQWSDVGISEVMMQASDGTNFQTT